MAEGKKSVTVKETAKNVVKAEEAKPAEARTEDVRPAEAKPAAEKKEPVVKETGKKEEDKPVAKKETVNKETVKKTPAAKKTPAKRTVAAKKETVKKETAVKRVAKDNVKITLEINNNSYTQESLLQSAKDVWVYDLGRDIKDFKSVELYIKPEDKAVYYVVNGEVTGSFGM